MRDGKQRGLTMKRTSFAVLSILLVGSTIGALAVEYGSAPNRAAQATAKEGDLRRLGRRPCRHGSVHKPGDDFFRYVNGAWFDKAVIPADRTSTGSFLDLDIESEAKVGAIMNELEAKKASLTPDEKRVRDLYHSYVDTARVEALGLKPTDRDLQAIAAAKTLDDVARLMGTIGLGAQSLFNTRLNVDDKNPAAYAVFLRQSGLGLPDRDYYLLDEPAIVAARTAYKAYIAEIFGLAKIADGDKKASAIFDLETEIAKSHWARAERRNAEKVYNPMSIAELEKFAPQFLPGRRICQPKAFPG
jgi:predicted metalloendopeptidase